jgi:hypothetical protein
MRKKSRALERVLAAVTAGILFFSSCKGNISAVSTDISKESLCRHMEFIASNETQGRMTASIGYKKAADYAVERFKSFGLEPGWEDASGSKSFYQSVPFIRNKYGKSTVFFVRKHGMMEELPLGPNTFVVANPGKGSLNLLLHSPVFVGYGIHEPELGWDDLADLDIRGKLAVMMAGFPSDPHRGPNFPEEVRRKYSDRRTGDALRFRNVMMRGAAGIIALPDRFIAAQWEGIVSQLKRSTLQPAEAYSSSSRGQSPIPSLLVHPDGAQRFFDELGYDPVSLKGDYQTFEMEELELGLTLRIKREKVNCYNIIGVVPGNDPELSREYITLGAHLDHLGKKGDLIFNGANDNASSCAVILGLAEAVAQNPLKRSVVFILFTAEEIGHFGSLHFVSHPLIPHEQIILNINLEQLGAKSRMIDGVGANGPADQEEILRRMQKNNEGIFLQFDDIEDTVSVISGSDTLSFYQKGLPAILLGSGGFPEHHTPNDNLSLIDYEHLHRAALFVLDYVKELGNK